MGAPLPERLAEVERNDPHFKRDLLDSRAAVELAARWLSAMGIAVVYRPTFVRPAIKERDAYSDCGDLEIMQRVEVKRRGFAFTGPQDYPYPDVLVDVCHAWDKARPKPYAYMIFGQDMRCAIRVVGASSGEWQRKRIWDRPKRREREFYFCPMRLVRFMVPPSELLALAPGLTSGAADTGSNR